MAKVAPWKEQPHAKETVILNKLSVGRVLIYTDVSHG